MASALIKRKERIPFTQADPTSSTVGFPKIDVEVGICGRLEGGLKALARRFLENPRACTNTHCKEVAGFASLHCWTSSAIAKASMGETSGTKR